MIQRILIEACGAVSVTIAVASCSGGGSESDPGTTSFRLQSVSVQNGAVWRINREIVFTFTEPVDFGTVSANTINIRSTSNVPATGVYTLRDPVTVVYQPSCPTRPDLSDAGLLPGGVTYVLRIGGRDTSANTVRSVEGVPLGEQQIRTFSTPASTEPADVFEDVHGGPPAPVVRAQGSSDRHATHLEIGGDPEERVYFELDADQQPVLSDPTFEAPLNLYSDTATHVAVVIAFDQPVDPSERNISESRMRLEYRDAAASWHALDTRVSLIGNCAGAGAAVRLEPIGILPSASALRAVVRAGFQDLAGNPTLAQQASFAVAPTRAVGFTSLTPHDVLSDEINESFALGAESPLSFEDGRALFDTPSADWGGGSLAASFAFDGTGGPGGTFDWVVREDQIVLFDTNRTEIVGGRDGVPTTTVIVIDGVLDVRNFTIQERGEVRVQGPNPMRINATGDVRIDGKLDLSGFNAPDVRSFDTGHQVENGGTGAGGGGRGGDGNWNTSGHTPRGGRGGGPFGQDDLGGEGGEMGVNSATDKNARRPGGGGGGRFARDVIDTVVASDWNSTPLVPPFPPNNPDKLPSMAALPGNPGNRASRGAESGRSPAAGGLPGDGPFLDGSDENDFFGVKPVVVDGELAGLVRGELPDLWAGYGGGGGGNATRTFPNPSWTIKSDEKGGGGGGGGGGLHVKALGRIVFGPQGRVLANGGRGGTGENTFYLDHVAGTGGAGSGGHVILESATLVDFTAGGAAVGAEPRDIVLAGGPPRKIGPTTWIDCTTVGCCTACLPNSNGGAGGPGIIQIHVPDPKLPPSDTPAGSDIIVPTAALGTANPFDQVCSPPAIAMLPTLSGRSKARSKWISIGGADQGASGQDGLVRFLFDGIETSGENAGKIKTEGSTVVDRTPLVFDDDLVASTSARILPDGFTLELIGAALATIRAGATNGISNDVYLRTPALLEDCVLRLRVVTADTNREDFTIAAATYDEAAPPPGDERLLLIVGTERGRPLSAFNPDNADGKTGYQLLPRFFQVTTDDLVNSLPDTAFVRLSFQAARDNGNGLPDEANPLVPWTHDIAEFNRRAPGELQFFRYEVEFDLDARNEGVTRDTTPVHLDFLKIPFVF